MATTLSAGGQLSKSTEVRTARPIRTVPWYIWSLVAAVISVAIGSYWDISWHMSIGRDSFWMPAHMAIYLCGVLAGVSSGYLILSATMAGDPEIRLATVRVWGFQGPLGAFIAAWGGVTMLVSAAFDNWWHNAYGLDVKIFSPPHVVLDGGVFAIQVGALALISSTMNRSSGRLRKNLDRCLLLLGGMMMVLALTVVWESTYRVLMHSVECYRAVAIVVPLILAGFAKVSCHRWPCTIIAGIYTAYAMVMLWLLPLFPATPKLGPVYQRITHLVPLEFPLLVIVPAVILDLVWPRITGWKKWTQASVIGAVFLIAFVAVQWPFADFLLSPASGNWFFGTHYFPYFEHPASYAVRGLFFSNSTAAQFWLGMAQALGVAIVSSRAGLAWGQWLQNVRR